MGGMPGECVGSLLVGNNRYHRPALPDGGRQTLSTRRILAREKWWGQCSHRPPQVFPEALPAGRGDLESAAAAPRFAVGPAPLALNAACTVQRWVTIICACPFLSG